MLIFKCGTDSSTSVDIKIPISSMDIQFTLLHKLISHMFVDKQNIAIVMFTDVR